MNQTVYQDENINRPLCLIGIFPFSILLLGLFIYFIRVQLYPSEWNPTIIAGNSIALLFIFFILALKRAAFDISRIELKEDGLYYYSWTAIKWRIGKKGSIPYRVLSAEDGVLPGFFPTTIMLLRRSGVIGFRIRESNWGKESYRILKQGLFSKEIFVRQINKQLINTGA